MAKKAQNVVSKIQDWLTDYHNTGEEDMDVLAIDAYSLLVEAKDEIERLENALSRYE